MVFDEGRGERERERVSNERLEWFNDVGSLVPPCDACIASKQSLELYGSNVNELTSAEDPLRVVLYRSCTARSVKAIWAVRRRGALISDDVIRENE